ncbi:dihydrodipicolinate synthetase [Caldicellulosiruptor saccharolyticus DSM 8903]|uniref:Dihydrodipicolinate synthetase n=1 Tax=Caldicellulosiruptor saccharolyticus (strain ATCC 43494 / DSM 8903 / Tp8T 6331) TaxID=351627 RepID=A4XN23_CALS8|nr:dihydrodipicolinate synthase family protein [Caldicellulosiruptor saccharolyticus]ABP68308.1 dihydrodipicolinate synthetase [Caldicellulosiruptor saccharolyticus DSM 8903]
MVTPYTQDGEINENELRKIVNFLIEKGIKGLFPTGSVGEFFHHSVEYICKVIEIVSQEAQGRVPVVPGACSSCVENTLKIAKFAASKGCPAVVISPPYYVPLKEEEIYQFYLQVLEKIPINVVLYDIPFRTNRLPPGVIEKLILHEKVIGIKDSSGSMQNLMYYIILSRKHKKDFSVMTGNDDILLPALYMGCSGSMSGMAAVVPEIVTEIYSLFENNDHQKAKELQFRVAEIVKLIEKFPFPVGYRIAMSIRGFEVGPHKQVVVPLPNTSEYSRIYEKMRNALENLLSEETGLNV